MKLTAVQAGAELLSPSSAIFRPGLRMFHRDRKTYGPEDQQEFRKHWEDFHTISLPRRCLPFFLAIFFHGLLEITSAVTCLSLSVPVV